MTNKHYRKVGGKAKLIKETCPSGYDLVRWRGKLWCRPKNKSWGGVPFLEYTYS